MSRLGNAMFQLREQMIEVVRAKEDVQEAEAACVSAEEILEMVEADFAEAQEEAVEAAKAFVY